jgi:hypothetical protein
MSSNGLLFPSTRVRDAIIDIFRQNFSAKTARRRSWLNASGNNPKTPVVAQFDFSRLDLAAPVNAERVKLSQRYAQSIQIARPAINNKYHIGEKCILNQLLNERNKTNEKNSSPKGRECET